MTGKVSRLPCVVGASNVFLCFVVVVCCCNTTFTVGMVVVSTAAMAVFYEEG